MVLYHGSDVKVENPSLDLSRKNLDFGAGFYSTENRSQAIEFARKVSIRKKQKDQIVNIYNFDMETGLSVLSILKFESPDKLWLDFVQQNRHGIYAGKQYDLIIGPVANDDVFTTLIIYDQGILNTEQTLEALKIKKLYNQFVFKTKKAFSFLKFSESFNAEAVT